MPTDGPRDFVDDLIESWARSRPDLDVMPVAVVTRLGRARDHLEGEMAALFSSFGVTPPSFIMLATIMRLEGADEVATEARIGKELGLTRNTIVMRVDRLVREGMVTRREDGAVDLTPQGRDLVDKVVPAHLDNLARLLSPLSKDEQDTLATLLRKLLLALET